MPWPLIKLLPKKTNFKFVRFAYFAAFLSVFAIIGSFVSMFTGGFRENPIAVYQQAEGGPFNRIGVILSHGFNLGIDFRGGTLLEVSAPDPIELATVRAALAELDMGDVQVQAFGDPHHVLVRFHSVTESAESALAHVREKLDAAVPQIRYVRTEVVGPKVSGELFASGLIALGLAMLLMLVYIWFRFELQFGFGAVLSLFHDTILTLGLFSVMRIDFTLTIIAAVLTIIGYSMNDTVVVFDRLRENLRKYRKMPVADVIDLSTNETLSRTMVTSVTALLAAVALWVYGGETLRGFAIAMVFGIVMGTYSSIYVAAPSILLLGIRRGEKFGAGEAVESEKAGKTAAPKPKPG
ncbi:MAG: protein translocase subunit SecF [Hyphomonadaceae bacterium]